MPRYRVEAIEKFLMRTIYRIEAASAEEAEDKALSGDESYEFSSPVDDPGEWIETISVKKEEE